MKAAQLLNLKFKNLTVIKKLGSKNHPQHKMEWLCLCDCGATRVCTTDDLKSGKATACYRDCLLHQDYKKYIGLQIKSLLILKMNKGICEYQCSCGIIDTIPFKNILCGNTSSCGRCNTQHIGQQFMNLTIIEYRHNNKQGGSFVSQCICGRKRIDACHRILSGHITSCGKCGSFCNGKKTSRPQNIIANMIDGCIENYKTELGYYLDIAIPNDYIGIEYDEWYWHQNKINEDNIRIKKLIDNGWKILHMKASNNIPSFNELQNGIKHLKDNNYSVIQLPGWGK